MAYRDANVGRAKDRGRFRKRVAERLMFRKRAFVEWDAATCAC